jgi:hypothetical protein
MNPGIKKLFDMKIHAVIPLLDNRIVAPEKILLANISE